MNEPQPIYTFNEHKHRFASWTAARSAQRSFTNTATICKAIDATSLRTFSEENIPITQQHFDEQHRVWCNGLIAHFATTANPCSYGRAAKIVAIYLKTTVILPTQGVGNNALIIHPPIDRILLKSLAGVEGLQSLNHKNWTAFDESEYREVMLLIRSKLSAFNWMLEEHWRVSIADAVEE